MNILSQQAVQTVDVPKLNAIKTTTVEVPKATPLEIIKATATTVETTPKPKLIAGETTGTYRLEGEVTDLELIKLARMLARRKLRKGSKLTQPDKVHRCLQTLMMDYPHEVFGTLLLDTQHRLIAFEELFRGTIDSASVYPREVVKHALAHNAAAVIFVHNHPSGDPEPSQSDHSITKRLKEALSLVDIRVLDHLVVGHEGYVSFAEKGFL